MATVGRVMVLLWAHILTIYAMYVMMPYLTDVWGLGSTHAAAIVNVFWGVVTVSPLFLAHMVDSMLGNYWMLLISSFAWIRVFVDVHSTSAGRRYGTCGDYKAECIGQGQKVLFYTALPLIAFGISAHLTSWNSFMAEQLDDVANLDQSTFCPFFCSFCAPAYVTSVAVLAIPYIKPWSLRFGIPAICTQVATLLFFSSSCSYKYFRPPGSPLTMIVRVFVAAVSKLFYRLDANELYEIRGSDVHVVPHTRSLRCLDKAAILIPTKPREEQVKNRWRLCRVTEVEETKTIIRMIPVWMTFILCGVVSAIGFTFFVQQLEHLNHKVGRLKVTTVVLLWFSEQANNQFAKLYVKFANLLGESGSRKFAPPVGIAVSMILAILCCITAAKVEDRRLGVVQRHGLVDKPDETVPMSMFWLLPQFILLGGFQGVFVCSATCFFNDQSPVSTRRYLQFFIAGVFGLGILGSGVSVYVVGKVSERGGKENWFQHDLNASRIDKYFWTLAWLMAINLAVFIVVAMFYWHKESELEDQEAPEFGGIDEPYDDYVECSAAAVDDVFGVS